MAGYRQAVGSFFMWGFEHIENKCSQVSMALLEHNVQFGFGSRVGQKIFFCGGNG